RNADLEDGFVLFLVSKCRQDIPLDLESSVDQRNAESAVQSDCISFNEVFDQIIDDRHAMALLVRAKLSRQHENDLARVPCRTAVSWSIQRMRAGIQPLPNRLEPAINPGKLLICGPMQLCKRLAKESVSYGWQATRRFDAAANRSTWCR